MQGQIKRPTVLITWGFTYLAIFLVPVILFSFVVLRSTSMISEESERANQNFAKQICTSMDKELTDVSNLAQTCIHSTEISTVLNQKEYNSTQARYNVYLAVEHRKVVAAFAGNVKGVYVFLSDGSALSLSTYYPLNYIDSLMPYTDFPYNAYMECSEQVLRDRFMVLEKEGQPYLCYICVPSSYSPDGAPGHVVVIANLNSLSSMLAQADSSNTSGVIALDEDNHLLFSNMDVSPETLSFLLDAEKNGRNQFQDENGSWQGFAVERSSVSPLRYIVITPRSAFLKSYLLVRNLTVICTVLAIVLFAALAWVMLRRSYAPLRALQVSVSGKKENVPFRYRGNEWEEIRQAVDKTLDENKRFSQELERQKQLVQQNLLMSLLRGRLHGRDELTPRRFCAAHGIAFPYDGFTVLLFGVQAESPENLQDYSLQFNVLRQAVMERLTQKYLCYLADTGGGLAVLLNFDRDEGMTELLRDDLHQLRSFLESTYHVPFYTAVSSVGCSFEEISKAYYEASYVMDYLLLHQRKTVLFYADCLSENTARLYLYSNEMEQRLEYYIRLGMEERAVRQLDLILDQAADNSSDLPEMVNCLLYDITGTLLKLMEPQERQNAAGIIRALSAAVSLEAKREILCGEIGKLCAMNSAQLEQKRPKVVDEAMEYINGSYTDPNLNVNSLAENFHISSSYLSKQFSEQTGQRLLDYINQTRLRQAKELLRQNVGVQEAAVQVGLRNSANLIRIFKKYEGITPGEFRDMAQGTTGEGTIAEI